MDVLGGFYFAFEDLRSVEDGVVAGFRLVGSDAEGAHSNAPYATNLRP